MKLKEITKGMDVGGKEKSEDQALGQWNIKKWERWGWINPGELKMSAQWSRWLHQGVVSQTASDEYLKEEDQLLNADKCVKEKVTYIIPCYSSTGPAR